MINRKSQAALEFLMTYGWAILVVLVAVGALAYFGVLSPDKFLPSKCVLQPGIGCLDFRVTAGQISVVIQNSLGFDMSAITVRAQDCGTDSAPATLPNGEKQTYEITCSPALGVSKYNGILNVSYTSSEGLPHVNQGTLTAKVE